ncbi:MAG: peptidoglycan-binding domain-containing protein [Roseibium sp.]
MSVLTQKSVSRGVSRIMIVLAASLMLLQSPAEAGPFRSGIIGGLGGLAIGGILGGGRGAAVGALVGGVGGAIVGATSQNRRQRTVRRPYTNTARAAAPRPRAAIASPIVSGIQGALSAKGYNPGAIDGRMGPATAQAISSYQQASGLLVTGQPSQALLDHIQKQGLPQASKPTKSISATSGN